ncbi:MAG TPA: 50S ribosomal protein L24 [Pyrinomonadaceae bacterium]|jgi:large subunit ribosomal protein L24
MAGTRKRTKIKKGDIVQVIAGRGWATFKGGQRTPIRGRVLEVSPAKGKVKVEGAAMVKKHERANPQNNRGGGIIEREAWIDISNVQLIDPESGKPTRVRAGESSEGASQRIATKSGRVIER